MVQVGFPLPNQPRNEVMRVRCALVQGHRKEQTRFEGALGAQRGHYLG